MSTNNLHRQIEAYNQIVNDESPHHPQLFRGVVWADVVADINAYEQARQERTV